MNVLDDYMIDPRLSLLDKTQINAQVLVPLLRALRAELVEGKADTIVRQALRDWSKQLFAAVGESVEGSPRRKWAAMQTALTEITEREVTFEMTGMTRKHWNSTSQIAGLQNSFARLASRSSARCWSAPPTSISSRPVAARSASRATRP